MKKLYTFFALIALVAMANNTYGLYLVNPRNEVIASAFPELDEFAAQAINTFVLKSGGTDPQQQELSRINNMEYVLRRLILILEDKVSLKEYKEQLVTVIRPVIGSKFIGNAALKLNPEFCFYMIKIIARAYTKTDTLKQREKLDRKVLLLFGVKLPKIGKVSLFRP